MEDTNSPSTTEEMPPAAKENKKNAHSQNDAPPLTPAQQLLKDRRFKLSRACDRCRRRRIKCDEGHPCQACITATSACTFEEPGKRTHGTSHTKSKRTSTLEDRMAHLESLIQAIPPAVLASTSAPPPSTPSHAQTYIFPPNSNMLSGIPPPALTSYPLMNPAMHFIDGPSVDPNYCPDVGGLTASTAHIRLSAPDTYLYIDDEGYTRWQGESSGLPLLDLLVERQPAHSLTEDTPSPESSHSPHPEWFPNRTTKRIPDVNARMVWKLITSFIAPDLMDSLVQCYLSTSYYILPFMHVPTFLTDYGNPEKWGEPGFATFIVSICCLASRHIDDPRVRANPTDSISSGTQWFELLNRLRTLPISDRPTLYTIQASLIAAVYAIGLGRLSKGAALLSEAVTMSVDAGLHRSSDTYDLFDHIEDEVRKRTFWCVYIWDKQLSAHFGRPPVIRLRDCDVSEPAPVDDEFITQNSVTTPPPGVECRMAVFVQVLRSMVVLERVLDVPAPRSTDNGSFLSRASAKYRGYQDLREEEAMLDEIHRSVPLHWAHSSELMQSDDTIRLTQAERLHCAVNFVRLLLHRHRFAHSVAERTANGTTEQTEHEIQALFGAQQAAVEVISTHLNVAEKGLMTYYGVHVIHQLTQAGRTLVAVLLNCKSETLQPLIPSGLESLRNCVGLLRRFSSRYVCGLRSGDMMEEFCRLTQIPLDTGGNSDSEGGSRPPWVRPVRKKTRSDSASQLQRTSHSPDSNVLHVPVDFFPANLASSHGGLDNDASTIDNYLTPNMFLTPEMMALFSEEHHGQINAPFSTDLSSQPSILAGGGLYGSSPS